MKQIAAEIAEEVKSLRRLVYYIELEGFAALYNAASETQKLRVDLLIKDRDTLKVKEWIDNQKSYSLETMSLLDLRMLAKGLEIAKIERFNKNQLISLIIDRRKQNDRRSTES